MDKSFVFKIHRDSNNETNWFYDTIFTINEDTKEIDLSDGDCDSVSGDLEEWVFVSFDNINKVNTLFEKMYPSYHDISFSKEQKKFYNKIKIENVRKLFAFLCIYCVKENGNMSSFKKLLDDNNIENRYSAYRSSSD